MKVILETNDLFAYNKIVNEVLNEMNGKKINPVVNVLDYPLDENEVIFFSIQDINATINNIKTSFRSFDQIQKGIKHQQNQKVDKTLEKANIVITNKALYIYNSKIKIMRHINLHDIYSAEINNRNLILTSRQNKSVLLHTNNPKIDFTILIALDTIINATKKD